MSVRPKKVAILAGGGILPKNVAEACVRDGLPFLAVNLDGAAGDWIETYKPLTVSLGQVGHLLDSLKSEGCDAVTMAGPLSRPELSKVRFDWQGAKMLPRVAKLFRRGDDALLTGIAALFEENGFRVIGPETVLRDELASGGTLTALSPNGDSLADIRTARAILMDLGAHDVGQAVVVAEGICLAIEAAEGTARMLSRVADLRRGANPSGVLVKLPKPSQDRRVDLPTIGPETVTSVAAANLAGIAVEEGGSFVLSREETIRLCDEAGLFLIGLKSAPE